MSGSCGLVSNTSGLMGLQGFSSSQFGVQESHVLLLLPDIIFTAEEMKPWTVIAEL